MKVVYSIRFIAALLIPVYGNSKKIVRCTGSYSGDADANGKFPSAAPTETVSPTCERGTRPLGPDECVDSTTWEFGGQSGQGCNWVATNGKCAVEGASENCPQVCDRCPVLNKATYPPTFSPTPTCMDLDDYCEPVLINDAVIPLCDWLQGMGKTKRTTMCETKNYLSLKQVTTACIFLDEHYPKAYKNQCDNGSYEGNLHEENSDLAVIEIAFSEICGRTCGIC
uniref:ShKT domain-containing protein n=1 Tax=Corethron hystrix TaxID=216773 RepID=A0A7S1C073_9STRA|mmetsp:Transcript_9004/g.19920  ORF Transcript_9004/g.19920 Transcript_9004/m.19920 type:complete len:225 (+) Transcript_9004:91-765(+)